jgi:hypothetical protein
MVESSGYPADCKRIQARSALKAGIDLGAVFGHLYGNGRDIESLPWLVPPGLSLFQGHPADTAPGEFVILQVLRMLHHA